MNPLFEDKVKKIHELMKIMLENFKVNFSYPDVEGLLDELPFPQLYLPLKKAIYEALLDLHIRDNEWESIEVWNMLSKYGVSGGLSGFDGEEDEGLKYPVLTDFLSDDFKFCLFDLEKYNQYVSCIETYLIKNSSYKNLIKLIYTYLSPEAGINIKDAIKGNNDPNSYFRELIKEDDLEYAIHFEDSTNYWSIDEYANTYGKEVIKYKVDMPPEYKEKYDNHMLVSSGWADGATIERKAPNLPEDLCEAFYASKGKYVEALFKQHILDDIDRRAQEYIEQGYEYAFSSRRRTGCESKFFKWINPEFYGNDGVPHEDWFLNYFLNKSIFMEILNKSKGDPIDKIVSNYTEFLKLIVSILSNKAKYDIPDEFVLSIIDKVYNRLIKTAIVTTINLYTRKDDSTIKKSDLKKAIRASHSIGTDRWNNCMAFYSDTLFKMEDLKVIAEHIPAMNRIIEIM